jgi:aryl-alcohol dehydrogenase-like predicted oxidoreductase
MKYRTLGKNGFKVSEIGLGCWQLGGDWGNAPNEDKALSILRAAKESGITLFDTADVYGDGRSERVIGTFLEELDSPVKVITKFGRGEGIYPDNYTEASLRQGVEGSLERLGVSTLDLVQLHCIPEEVLEQGDIFDDLRKLQNEGLIQGFGASVETKKQGLLCMKQEGLVSLQIIFNVFRQHYGPTFFEEADAQGVGLIVRLPLASGLLSGKFDRKTEFSENDHRYYNRNGEAFNVGETFSGLPYEKGLELVDKIKSQYLPENMSMVEFALRWILDHPSVSSIIPGASSVDQVVANAKISELPELSSETHNELKNLFDKEILEHIRGPF